MVVLPSPGDTELITRDLRGESEPRRRILALRVWKVRDGQGRNEEGAQGSGGEGVHDQAG